MTSRIKDSGRLGREEWLEAALRALGSRGLKAVAVEPLARSLSVTKGSFYWHFASRRELIEAILDYFEFELTVAVVTGLESVKDPRERLIALIQSGTRPETLGIEAALAASAAAGIEPVASRYRAVSARRQAHLVKEYGLLGLGSEEAERWGTATYTWFLGLLQRLAIENNALDPEAIRREAELVIERLVPKG